jgi:LmbE family N-acetylglucosaminyl deacetylase
MDDPAREGGGKVSPLRRRAFAALQSRFAALPEWFEGDRLAVDAVVFAPHADDETLGCGGTIARKVAAGARVRIVVMTDGSGTQTGRSPEDLVATRRAEAVAALALLGVPEADVRFLEFPDGTLDEAGGALLDAVGSVLLAARPAQVFVPYRDDGHPDHEAAYRAVRASAKSAGLGFELYEYPVWAWRHWPWVGLRPPLGDELPPWLASVKFAGGWRFARKFRVRSGIGGVLPAKSAALAEYRSQLAATDGESEPWALDRVSRGDWLRCFEQDFEVFRATRIRP